MAVQALADGQVAQPHDRVFSTDGGVRWFPRRLTPFTRAAALRSARDEIRRGSGAEVKHFDVALEERGSDQARTAHDGRFKHLRIAGVERPLLRGTSPSRADAPFGRGSGGRTRESGAGAR